MGNPGFYLGFVFAQNVISSQLNRGQGKLNMLFMEYNQLTGKPLLRRKPEFEILLIKPTRSITQKTYKLEDYIVGEYVACSIYSVQRVSDGEVFTIGDRVSNDLIKGKITEFRITDGTPFVVTTWSNVGMDLDSIHKITTLPSKYQEGDPVKLDYHGLVFETGWIHKVHFSKNTTTYDVEILMQTNGKTHNFRMYNVLSSFVFDRTDSKL